MRENSCLGEGEELKAQQDKREEGRVLGRGAVYPSRIKSRGGSSVLTETFHWGPKLTCNYGCYTKGLPRNAEIYSM